MIKILKASAGSGKTYALAKEYISLLTGKYAYRHILAVTFTNKATAEMKGRILKFLSESSDKNEREMLRDILHDYSAFAVSTIDKFFQQALKAFAREIGQVADYQIDLDKDSLIREAMDRILDSLTRKDTEILDWMQRSVATDLSQGKRVNIEESLYEMGGRLMMQGAGSTDELQKRFSKKNLQAIRANCEQIIGDFTDELNAAAKDVVVSKANSVKQLAPYLKGFKTWEMIPQCKSTLMKEADGSVFCDLLFGERYTWYCTAWLLRDMSFSLGLAGEFYRSYRELLKEKNVMVLDESNVILKDIIAGSDAPFVYEKMGVRYENFLIDEFQDTSNIQWENFRPLLKESDANNHKNLIVGDVKQSIYRWRDSDWTLLDHKVNEDFPLAKVELKQENRRSLKNIVNFNNAFFEFASRIAGHPGLYADVKQKIMTDDAREGLVRVSFCGKDEQISKVRESIADAVSAGARYGEITVLVRANAEGSTIANALIQDGIPVVSDDSLNLKSSKILRKLTGILANHENPDDKINSYLARTEAVEFPDEFHSLTDLCEVLLRQLRESSPEDFEGETLYIQAFMDDLREKCPWDRKQTFDSLRQNTIEETYELATAISRHDMNEISKELGDVLLHVVFYAKMGSEDKNNFSDLPDANAPSERFDIADVCNRLCDKLVFRHPHVYGEAAAQNAEEVSKLWEQVKLKEKGGNKTVLGGIPDSLPSLVKAYRIQDKVANVGFDWREREDVWAKVKEEIAEFEAEVRKCPDGQTVNDQMTAEFGDLMFALINAARLYKIKPDNALEQTNLKFIRRFNYIEQRAKEQGKELKEMSLEEMDELWNEAKENEKS